MDTKGEAKDKTKVKNCATYQPWTVSGQGRGEHKTVEQVQVIIDHPARRRGPVGTVVAVRLVRAAVSVFGIPYDVALVLEVVVQPGENDALAHTAECKSDLRQKRGTSTKSNATLLSKRSL